MKVLRNRIRCNRCGTTVESAWGHDYARCPCGACAADGGTYYLRRTFDHKDCFTELSEMAFDPEADESRVAALVRDNVALVYAFENEFITAQVSTRGAELRSVKAKDGTEYLWQGDIAVWEGQAPVLFPFAGRLPEKTYTMDGKTYHMDIHGFASERLFRVIEQEESRILLELTETEETLAKYPRKFSFRVEYALEGKELKTTFTVENKDHQTMYFGLGGHPAFCVPLENGQKFDDYRLTFPEAENPEKIKFSSNLLVAGFTPCELQNGIDLHFGMFDNDALFFKGAGHVVNLESERGSRGVTVRFPDMDYVGFWHMAGMQAAYICIEPWCSLPAWEGKAAVFEEMDDLLQLASGATYKNSWIIEIR